MPSPTPSPNYFERVYEIIKKLNSEANKKPPQKHKKES